jgi:hypothetical protein
MIAEGRVLPLTDGAAERVARTLRICASLPAVRAFQLEPGRSQIRHPKATRHFHQAPVSRLRVSPMGDTGIIMRDIDARPPFMPLREKNGLRSKKRRGAGPDRWE